MRCNAITTRFYFSGSAGLVVHRIPVSNDLIPRELLSTWYICRLGRSTELRVLLRRDRHTTSTMNSAPCHHDTNTPLSPRTGDTNLAMQSLPVLLARSLARPVPRCSRTLATTVYDDRSRPKPTSMATARNPSFPSTVCCPRRRYHVIHILLLSESPRDCPDAVPEPRLGGVFASYTATEIIKCRLSTG
jgi:hypothetical protein